MVNKKAEFILESSEDIKVVLGMMNFSYLEPLKENEFGCIPAKGYFISDIRVVTEVMKVIGEVLEHTEVIRHDEFVELYNITEWMRDELNRISKNNNNFVDGVKKMKSQMANDPETNQIKTT